MRSGCAIACSILDVVFRLGPVPEVLDKCVLVAIDGRLKKNGLYKKYDPRGSIY
jgi:hypothetical protein